MLTGLRGVDLGVPDVASHARFYTDVWRLAVVAERNGSAYLRGSGAHHHILALHPRESPALLGINLAASDRAGV
ncbi:MAG: glyoxalase, partial [Candidatus Parcubacteria bacterium]|nr:glyoxalase [Burkholderiales bacterium]